MSEHPKTAIIHALLDAQGHILSADAAIMRLQHAAGGADDGKLLVPQLAAIARLAQRLRLLVARPLQTANEGTSISMWVQARPHKDGVELTITDWRETLVPVSGQSGLQRSADIALASEGWSWRVDQELRFVDAGDAPAEERPEMGSALTSAFALDTVINAENSVLACIAQRLAFFGESVGAARMTGRHYVLSGHPVYASDGSFAGYRGKAALVALASETQEGTPDTADRITAPRNVIPDFGRPLDLALRQPLGRIIANAETISGQLEGPLRNDYAGYAADIANAGRHLMELVDDLADLQAIDRPNFQVACEEVDLADVARRTAGLLALKAADKRIRVQVPAGDETVVAMAEFRRVLQIVVNLVGNAVRYSPEDSIIWVRVTDEGEMAELIVADQGQGIALEDQVRVFEKFERLGRQDAAGSGLGLYISRQLARAMGGDIHIDSAMGQGARFILSLPKA
jgi:signal transduction histidine kinase